MRKFMWLAIFLLIFQVDFVFSQSTPPSNIQIIPNAGPDLPLDQALLETWVLDILHGGGGEIDTSSIEFIGSPEAIGFFMGGYDFSTNCPPHTNDTCMDEGLIISTGKVFDEGQFQPRNGKKSDVLNTYVPGFDALGDSSLLKMIKTLWQFGPFDPPQVGDLAVLQFNYKPYSDEIGLKYMFGSEEYPNGNDATDIDLSSGTDQHYDLLGIFIENPDYDPWQATNRATSNFGAEPPPRPPSNWITIENVNANTNAGFFLENNIPPTPFDDDYSGYGTQYDAVTIPGLRAIKKLSKCRWYTVKIAIEDYLYVDPKNPEMKTFAHNSAVFLPKGGLSGGIKKPGWTVETNYTNSYQGFEGKLIEGGCNELDITYTLAYEASPLEPYFIGYQILAIGDDTISPTKVEVIDITDPNNTFIITGDTLWFDTQKRQTVKKIRLSVKDIDADILNKVQFTYSEDPCDYLIKIPGGLDPEDKYGVIINLDLINNEPLKFNPIPSIPAYCKDTVTLTTTKMLGYTEGGVDPKFIRWPLSDPPSPPGSPIFKHVVDDSPDWVTVIATDLCPPNGDTTYIKIINKPIILDQIQQVFLCGPGQEADIKVPVILPNGVDYSIEHVKWSKQTPPVDLGDEDGDVITVEYDNVVGDDIWTCLYEVIDVCGGEQNSSFTVNQSSLVLNNDGICKGDPVELTTGTPAQWYKWWRKEPDGSETLVGTDQSVIDTNYQPNQDTIKYKLEILDNCDEEQFAWMEIYVSTYEPKIITIPGNEICFGESITLEANEGATEYLWEETGESTRSITLDATEYQVGTNIYHLSTISDNLPYYYCENSAEVEFTVYENPETDFTINPENHACTNTEIIFEYTHDVANRYLVWDFGDGSPNKYGTPTSYQYSVADTYLVNLFVEHTYPSEYRCSSDTTIELIVDPLPVADFTFDVVDDNHCLPVTVNFTDDSEDLLIPGASFSWDFGNGNTGTGETAESEYTEAGWYSVKLTVSNTERCSDDITKSNIIQVNPNPTADFEAHPWLTTMDAPEIEFTNSSLSDSTLDLFDWEFGENGIQGTSSEENPINEFTIPNDNIPVTFIIETINGCPDTVVKFVGVSEFVRLFIPNAFTPNGDGVDDKFEIKGTPVTDWNLYIYDRWGAQIWSTHNYETQWEGTDRSGNPVPAGTYIYQITGTDYKLEPVAEKGQVTVVR